MIRGRRPSARPGAHFQILGVIISLFLSLTFGTMLLCALGLVAYMLYLDAVIRTEFDQKRWAMPAKVFARPLELFSGMSLNADGFAQELRLLRYRDINCALEMMPPPTATKGKRVIKRKVAQPKVCTPPANGGESPSKPGSFSRKGEVFEIVTRDFTFWDGKETARKLRLTFAGDILVDMASQDGQPAPGLLRLDPPEIAGIYPSDYEDRILLKAQELPPALVDTLLAVEDRDFFQHAGVDPKGIFRALVTNLRAGHTVQGGSTLTQQLVKNLFLSNERSIKRKVNEMLMALVIDSRYSKTEILEAYSNAIYLGQDGKRAIHGFGLASQFYFGLPLDDLDLHQVALLVGMVKGPSLYDPRRHIDAAKERRALVLEVMAEQQLISAADAETAKQMNLDVTPKASGITAYPAFLELVQRQLRKHYKSEDLISEGLRVFTTLDPRIQAKAERTIVESLPPLERSQPRARPLQGAIVVTDTQTGEVLAIVGDREPKTIGFNRAINTKRLAGSLIKPITYLTALEQPHKYTLITRINDSPFSYQVGNKYWTPGNYDRRFHGSVSLRDALAKSYNIPAVRVGLDMQVSNVVKMLQRLGLDHEVKPYPSLLLGALDVSPLDIAQIYSTIASGGFRIPLRTIREVTDVNGKSLKHYALDVQKTVEPGPVYLITHAMQQVVRAGTAAAMKSKIPTDLNIAGKTGTTDDYRDSWFAGFSGDRLAVVWLGRDDNKSTRLSGGQGALRVWMDLMAGLQLEPIDVPTPPGVLEVSYSGCRQGRTIPFLIGSAPRSAAVCSSGGAVAKTTPPDTTVPPDKVEKPEQPDPPPDDVEPADPTVDTEAPPPGDTGVSEENDDGRSHISDFFQKLND